MYNVRLATDKDLIHIADIEDTVYGQEAFDKYEIAKIRQGKKTSILVVEENDNIIGYCIFTIGKKKIYLLRLTVVPEKHQKGIGGRLITKLKNRMKNLKIIEAELEDDNIVGHLFLKAYGFKCIKILWGTGAENDLYLFQYHSNVPSKLP